MTQRMSQRQRRAFGCGLVLTVAALALVPPARAGAPAPAAVHRVEHRLLVDDQGRVAEADLTAALLDELGLRVHIARDALEGSVTIADTSGRLALAGAALVLAPLGVELDLEPGWLVVRVDRVRVGRHVDDLEVALRGLLGASAPVFTLERVAGSRDRGPPVVLIHGLDSRADRLRGSAQAIAQRGYDVHLLHYPDDGRIEPTAQALGHLLRQLRRDTGQPITLVTTSMGGVIARTYLELDPAYDGEVARLIACCPPFAGSPMARFHVLAEVAETLGDVLTTGSQGLFVFDGLGQAAADLAPDSLLMQRLRAAQRAPGVRYSILAGQGDDLPPEALDAIDAVVAGLRGRASGSADKVLLDAMTEIIATARSVSGDRGDGAVSLASQSLPGVRDRVVLPYSHLEFLDGDGASGPIPALAEVVERLPRP